MKGFLSIHAGPKRTASTFLQNVMSSMFSYTGALDATAHEGNSHELAMTFALEGDCFTKFILDEASLMSDVTRRNSQSEIARLRGRLSDGLSVCLSSELFAQIHPSAIDLSLCPPDGIEKRVVFLHRDSDSLLSSLFSNSIVGGYRGTINDFIEDVLAGNINNSDIFPSIEVWKDTGWNVYVAPFKEKDIETTSKKVLEIMFGINIDIEYLRASEFQKPHRINRSLSPENLLRISIVSNALHEHPRDLRDNLHSISFVNQVLVPFFRDSPYTTEDFNTKLHPKWRSFVQQIDANRRYLLKFLN